MALARTNRPLDVSFDESGLDIVESHHADNFRMEWTANDFWKVLLVISGEGLLLAPGRKWPLPKQSLLLVPPKVANRIEDKPGTPLSICILCIKEVTPFEELRAVKSADPEPIHDGEIIALAESVMRRLLVEKTRKLPGRRLISAGLAATLLGRMARSIATGGPNIAASKIGARANVERYAEELKTSFGEPDTLDSAARRLGLSRRRFTQLFREITGEAWLPHLKRLRIEHAKHLLNTTDRSIAAVAFECGFEDLSNFYRTFKTATGLPPKAWRERPASAKRH